MTIESSLPVDSETAIPDLTLSFANIQHNENNIIDHKSRLSDIRNTIISSITWKNLDLISGFIYSVTNPFTYILPLQEIIPLITEPVINYLKPDSISEDDPLLQYAAATIATLCYCTLANDNWKTYRAMVHQIHDREPASDEKKVNSSATDPSVFKKCWEKISHHTSPVAKGSVSSLSFGAAVKQILSFVKGASPSSSNLAGILAGIFTLLPNIRSQYVNYGIGKKPSSNPARSSASDNPSSFFNSSVNGTEHTQLPNSASPAVTSPSDLSDADFHTMEASPTADKQNDLADKTSSDDPDEKKSWCIIL